MPLTIQHESEFRDTLTVRAVCDLCRAENMQFRVTVTGADLAARIRDQLVMLGWSAPMNALGSEIYCRACRDRLQAIHGRVDQVRNLLEEAQEQTSARRQEVLGMDVGTPEGDQSVLSVVGMQRPPSEVIAPEEGFTHMEATYDGSGSGAPITIYVDGKPVGKVSKLKLRPPKIEPVPPKSRYERLLDDEDDDDDSV